MHWRVVDLGTMAYRDAWDRQLAIVEARKAGVDDDVLLLVEHPHVITLGRGRAAPGNVLAAGEVEVVAIERGGDVTYHGPGQIVAYPIVLLREDERDLHRYLRGLEEAAIRTLARWDLAAGRVSGKTGVWIARPGSAGPRSDATASPSTIDERRKICSIGIACRRWVTFHGLALNVTTDLGYFRRINPCGFDASVMTSMEAELGTAPPMAEVKARLAEELGTALDREVAR